MPNSRVWCDRAPYIVKGNQQEVQWEIEDAKSRGQDFIYFELAGRPEDEPVALNRKMISAIEKVG